MVKQTKWVITGQVESVEIGQKKDRIKFGKGEMKSTLCLDAGEATQMQPGEKVRVTVEIDPSLDFGEDD